MREAIQADSMGEHLMAAKLPRIIACALSGRMVAGATIAFTLAAGVSAQAPGPPGSAVVAFTVGGDVTRAMSITPADLKTMPRTTVTVSEEGREVKYDGVLVGEVLKRAGAPLGRDLSGPAVATYVLAKAKDGYQVVFSLPELDPAFTPNDIIIADTIDGKPLFEYQGPFRIVAPHDKRGARSIRMLQSIDVVRLRK
jgi:DMSO/TMAO reductase YedYZ molybdopterin-dependent catalytic subunit